MWALILALGCGDDTTTADSGETPTITDTGTTTTDDTADTQPPTDTVDTEPPPVEDCGSEGDEDGDGLADCEDPDCADVCVEDCESEGDEDQDGLADCDDPDCFDLCVEDCDDGIDNDGDGREDCRDIDCVDECPEDCENGQDDDYDGLVDCEDGECADDLSCYEDCSNGDDDDRDGKTDCDDDDCWGTAECATVTAHVTGGRAHTTGQVQYGSSYGPGGPPVYHFTLSFDMSAHDVSGELTVDYGSSVLGCNWYIDSMSGGVSHTGYSYTYQIPVLWRSGWRTSGACGGVVGSEVLPDALSWYSSTGLALPRTPGPGGGRGKLWYVGRLATYDYISEYNRGRTSSGRFYYSYTYGIELGWDPLFAGDSTSYTGL